jgi:hypothetical protein
MPADLSQEEVTKEVNDLTERLRADANKGPEQIKADRIIDLRRDYLEAQNAAKNAPIELENAKKRYLELKDGDDYDVNRKDEYEAEAREFTPYYIKVHNDNVDQAKKAYKMYEAVVKFTAQSVEDYVNSLKLHISSVEQNNSSAQYKNTSQRKTYYLGQEFDTVTNWDTVVTLLIVSVSLVYAYHFFYIHKKFKSILLWFGLLLLLISSYLLPLIVTWVLSIPQPVNIYSSWAKTDVPEWHGGDF